MDALIFGLSLLLILGGVSLLALAQQSKDHADPCEVRGKCSISGHEQDAVEKTAQCYENLREMCRLKTEAERN